MAVIRSGVLGNTRGKVAGVVGSQWKKTNYIREYVKPANPDTALQQTIRGQWRDCVAFCKHIVGPVFNAYTDRFLKGMSGFNFFMKRWVGVFDGSPTFAAIKLTEGKLSPPDNLTVTYNTADGATVLAFDKNLGNNGSDTDKIFWAIYDETNDQWYFADAEVVRSGEGDTQTLPTGLTAGDLHCWLWAAEYKGSIVVLISNSDYANATAP
jgi:hypothetical protein